MPLANDFLIFSPDLSKWTNSSQAADASVFQTDPVAGAGTQETWHTVTITAAGWTAQVGKPGFRYMAVVSPPQHVFLEGYLSTGTSLSTTLGTISAAQYHPPGDQPIQAWTPGATGSAWVLVDVSGNIKSQNVPSGATLLYFQGFYSLV